MPRLTLENSLQAKRFARPRDATTKIVDTAASIAPEALRFHDGSSLVHALGGPTPIIMEKKTEASAPLRRFGDPYECRI